MNNDLQRRISKLEQMMSVQRGCINPSDENSRDYMHGLLNGMIYSHSLLTDMPPDFLVLEKPKKTKIRHKGRK